MKFMTIRDYRPKIHFSARKGWLNDPNGLLYKDGVWNLYFQHNPEDCFWGPMHWGHAVSSDLIHWTELPIAIWPTDQEFIFSGSMVYDRENTSGLAGKNPLTGELIPPMVAAYTSHDPETNVETQSLAYSHDMGISFQKYEGNPVIKEEYRDGKVLLDFRDPKVFWNEKKDRWCMILSAFDQVEFYASDDLKNWTKTGQVTHPFTEITNCFACSDLVRFDTEDGEKWVLMISLEDRPGDPMARTLYLIGSFDGDTFTVTDPTDEPLWIDFGWDNYAGVSFNDTEKPIMINWGVNPRYANFVPTALNEYRCHMTLARQMSLVKCTVGYRLCFQPVGLAPYLGEAKSVKDGDTLYSECFHMEIHGSHGKLMFENYHGKRVVITVTEDKITFDRSNAGEREFHDDFCSVEYAIRTVDRYQASDLVQNGETSADINMKLIFDVSCLEIYADGGLETASMVVFPKDPYNKILLEGDLSVSISDIRY